MKTKTFQQKTHGETRLQAFGREMEELRNRVLNEVGEVDAGYIRRVITLSRLLNISSRVLIIGGAIWWQPLAIVFGVLMLSMSQIIENMEIGHNVLHGQYDFMNDPKVNSRKYEWGPVVTSKHWKHLHNYVHHTYTNVIGRDHDVGYGFIRITGDQPWKPHHIYQTVGTTILAFNFQHLTALHDARPMEYVLPKSWRPASAEPRPGWKVFFRKISEYQRKALIIMAREYVFFPLLAGPHFLTVLLANFAARTLTNLWEFTIIFCGHFTKNTRFFSEEEYLQEGKGGWYLRQILGSGNLEGSPFFCFLTGHLSHQIEHHLFPDIPAHRYPQMATEVQRICKKYGVPYNTGPFLKQFSSVLYRIVKFSFPGTKESGHSATVFDMSRLHEPLREDNPWVEARVSKIIQETPLTKTYRLIPSEKLRHKAGQFINIRVAIEGSKVTRSYTVSSAENSRYLDITVKKMPKGQVSNWLFNNLRPGDSLEITHPCGDFLLPADKNEKLVLVTGGSGITPAMSMLRTLDRNQEKRDLVFLHAASREQDVIFRKELERIAKRNPQWKFLFVLEEKADGCFHGRVSKEILETQIRDLAERTVLLCGPAPMMEACRKHLHELGVPNHKIITEDFVAPQKQKIKVSGPKQVVFAKSQAKLTCSGEDTILEEAEKAGLSVEYGCRQGICHTCKATKSSGIVQNTLTGQLSSEGSEDIRICVSQPISDVVVEL